MRLFCNNTFFYSPFGNEGGAVITVHAPATVANMVCGFDVLGFAVNEPYDEMHIRFCDRPGVTIHNLDDYNLPTQPELNVAGAALLAMLEEIPEPIGFELAIRKQIKPGSGPSIFMLSKDEATAKEVQAQMHAVYERLSLDHHTYVTTINPTGVRLVDQ